MPEQHPLEPPLQWPETRSWGDIVAESVVAATTFAMTLLGIGGALIVLGLIGLILFSSPSKAKRGESKPAPAVESPALRETHPPPWPFLRVTHAQKGNTTP